MAGLVQQSADVRIREIDLSQVIASNSSSRAAIVFVSKKGRVGRFNITNAQSFVDEYGPPDAAVSLGHYSALDFLQEGTSIDCVRVVAADARLAGLMLNDVAGETGLTTFGDVGVADPAAFDFEAAVVGSDMPLLLFTPKRGPGSHGNLLSIRLRSENIDVPATPLVSTSSAGGTLTAATYSYKVTAISAIGETTAAAASSTVVAAGTANKMSLTWDPIEGARGYRVYGRVTGGAFGLIATLNSFTTNFDDTGTITPDATKLPPTVAPTPTTRFTVQIFDDLVNSVVPAEEFACTLQDETDEIGQQLEIVQRLNAFSELLNVHSFIPQMLSAPPVVKAVAKTSLSGGASGSAVTNNQIAQAWTLNFSDAEKVKVQILINGGYTDTTVQQTMVQIAEKRADAVAILDMPQFSQKSADAIAYRQLVSGIDSSYAAIYTSDNFVSDTYTGKKLYTPPSGWAAAVCARTDRLVGPQSAPAGLNRGIIPVLGTRVEYDGQERTDLFNAQVNYTRKVIGSGTSVFEQVTMFSKHSALSWLNVRRMLNVIKSSVKDFLMFSLEEPNDDFTRKQIVTACTEYLQSWKDARGISDFLVVADDTNNDPAHYNLGILKVAFFITPIIPIHEIQLDVVITKRGVAFSEININNLA